MVAYSPREVATSLPVLIEPTPPTETHKGRVAGFRRCDDRVEWELSPEYVRVVGMEQRILARYVLGYDSRATLCRRYGYSERQVQSVIRGETYKWLTQPVRDRFVALGICGPNAARSFARDAAVKAALEKLAARAWDVLCRPARYTPSEIMEVSTDLYLISGAWREDEA